MDALETHTDQHAARAASPPRRRRAAMALALLCLLIAGTLGAARRAGAQDYGPGPAKVQNVTINDSFAHSVILRWDAPRSSGLSTLGGYCVAWAIGTTGWQFKMVGAGADGKAIFQAQPLVQNQPYTIAITPMDSLGAMGQTLRIANVSAKGTYEANLRQATANGAAGFLYLPENDPVNGRVNPLKINVDAYDVYSGDANGAYFDHSGVAVNNQQHWHMIANDYGSGAITCRVKGAIPLADGGTRYMMWDCDGGPFARQTWYIVLTPNKVEQFLLFPNNGDGLQTGNWPAEQIQIKFDGVNARVRRIAGGNEVAAVTFDWRKGVAFNVRQVMQMAISRQGVQCFADVDYNNVQQQRGSLATDLSAWNSCYAYFTLGSYNNRKFDMIYGTSATGQAMKEFQGGNMHFGNVAFTTPPGQSPPAELSYFLFGNLKDRSQNAQPDISQPLTVTIPDAIPADATARELVFTDRNGCIPCLSGRNKLRLSVNGVVLPNKHEDEAWRDYPTYRWQIPAGVLKRGANVIVFGQTGTPDPIGISNLHIDIHVPANSPAIAAYTPPPAHPVLETMPDHTELEGWTIPHVEANLPPALMSGKTFVPVIAQSAWTQHLAGNAVPFDSLWAELDGKTVWTQDTNAAGLGSLSYNNGFLLDTKQVADGYHALVVKAHSKSGSQGVSNGSSIYNYDANYKILICNTAANKTAPMIQNVQMVDNAKNAASPVNPGDSYYVRRNQTYSWLWSVVSPNLLTKVELWWTNPNGIPQLSRAYNPSQPSATKQTAAGTQLSFGDSGTLYDWWTFDGKGQDKFTIIAADVFGNTASYPFSWSLVPAPAPPDPSLTARVPVIKSFGSDPLIVHKGWACLLSWNTADAASVTIDNGIGAVAATGTVCVTPTKMTIYKLTATSAKGAVTKSVTVMVVP